MAIVEDLPSIKGILFDVFYLTSKCFAGFVNRSDCNGVHYASPRMPVVRIIDQRWSCWIGNCSFAYLEGIENEAAQMCSL